MEVGEEERERGEGHGERGGRMEAGEEERERGRGHGERGGRMERE